MKRIFYLACTVICICLFFACSNESILPEVSSNEKLENENYALKFSNFTTINVKINSTAKGGYYKIYYQNPYNEFGDVVAEPFLCGTAPISTKLEVPSYVKKLYILGEGNLCEVNVEDINKTFSPNLSYLNSKSRATNEVTEEIKNQIKEFFIEGNHNVFKEDLYNCYDLDLTQNVDPKLLPGNVNLNLTYLGDGGIALNSNSSSPVYGKLWMYTYPTIKRVNKSLTTSDCVFYGKDSNGNPLKLNFDDIVSDDISQNTGNYLFWSGEAYKNNPNEENIGDVAPINFTNLPTYNDNNESLSIGFVYISNCENPQSPTYRFTTPILNTLRQKTTLRSGKYKDDNFTVDKKITHGVIQNFVDKSIPSSVNVLGIENRAVSSPFFDGDFNDMLVLIQADRQLTPCCDIKDVNPNENYTVRCGTLAFEDNYPAKADFDFNDIVVYYYDVYYYNEPKHWIKTKLLAYGCDYNNIFGFLYNDEKDSVVFYNNINGYVNVNNKDIDINDANCKVSKNYINAEVVIPYVYNGNHRITPTTIDSKDAEYPYVIDIPEYDGCMNFRWCLEKLSIENTYTTFKYDKSTGKLTNPTWYLDNVIDNRIVNAYTIPDSFYNK